MDCWNSVHCCVIVRIKIEDLEDGDNPYLIVSAVPYDDEIADASDLKFLTDEIYQAHAQCVSRLCTEEEHSL